MRACLVFVTAAVALASDQSAATTYITDLNGNRVAVGQTTLADGVTTDLRQSINGREVPMEQVEEKQLSKSGNTTVTERIVKHYGANGDVVSTDRVVTETTETPGGGSLVHATTYRSDLNGDMTEAERKTVDTRVNGAETVTDTTVERPSLSGSFQVAQKSSATTEPISNGTQTNETVYLRNADGDLYEAQRLATTETKSGNQTVKNMAIYEPGVNGNLSLTRQNVTTTTGNPDGTSTEDVEIFGRVSDGQAREAGAAPALTEKRIYSREKGTNGGIVETQSVQLPSVNDPGHLNPARVVAETVCRGDCTQKP